MKSLPLSSRLSTKKSVGWFASGKFTLAVMVSAVALGVLLAPHQVESSRKVRVLSGMTPFGNTYVVNGTGDGEQEPGTRNGCRDLLTGKCTLRAAIQLANGSAGVDDITFDIPTSDPGYSNGTWTINLSKRLDSLSESVNITGPGLDKLIVNRNSAIPFGIFNVTTTGTVSFSDLSITNGSAPDLQGIQSGGGINNAAGGTVNVTNCVLIGNSTIASVGGGGINNQAGGTVNVSHSTLIGNSTASLGGGGINNQASGTVNVSNSTISGNSTASLGGGIYNVGTVNVSNSALVGNSAAAGGGGIANLGGAVNVTDSTVSANSTEISGGGINNLTGAVNVTNSTLGGNSAKNQGGGVFNGGTMTVTNSTVIGNSANSGDGGGISNTATMTVTNSTLSGNSANNGKGGGINNSGAATMTVTNSTLSGNSAGSGGAIFNLNPSFTVKSSLIASNLAGQSVPDANGSFTSLGFNLIGRREGSSGFSAPTDQTGTIIKPLDPKLDPNGLRPNGGPTQTIALLLGSPAIDKGTSALPIAGNLITDQRGAGFPRTFDDLNVPNAEGGDGTDIGAFELQTGVPTPTPTPTPTPIPTPTPNLVQLSSSNYSVVEDCTTVTITVNRTGDTSGAASVSYATSDVTATERRDYIAAIGRLSFAPGETSKSFAVLINEDSYVEGPETFNVSLSNPSGAGLGAPATATVQIIDDASEPATNITDDSQNFVCQHYHDFLNRQPDASGLNFWTNEITSCGTDQACIEVKRVNVSASFYLSIEFQNTGYLVERLYKAAYGDAGGISTFGGPHALAVPIIRLNEFLSDTQEIGKGVIVGQGNWQQDLENNKQTFTPGFVQRARFMTAFPSSMTPGQFVDKLNLNAGNVLSAGQRATAIDLFGGATDTSNIAARAQVLRQVAENADLNISEFNRAFVLMEYFGYLRRNPNDPQDSDYTGYDFWLTKLNQFNGNFVNAEMVRAFITSFEYRNRFGP